MTLLLEIFFGFIFEVVVKGVFYGLRQLWFAITGQDGKAEAALDKRKAAQEARRGNIERIRQQKKLSSRW